MSKAPIVDPLSTTDGDEALYGPATLPPVRANAVQQIPLEQIRPDWKQPRRAIPVAVMHHDWKTVNIRRMLNSWGDRVRVELGNPAYWIGKNLPEWLRSAQPLPELVLKSGVVTDFFELVSLAASICAHGLTNPITVVQDGDHYVIETGERRFLAYSLLSAHLLSDGKWDSIPALVVQDGDVWRQAAENGSRQPLNAIGMARQIALLVMDMYKGDEDVQFQRWEELVQPGECDQAFYAQVKKGTTYPIKKGELERVLAVTGLKSSDHVSLYRALLDLDPELWVKADRENLTEGAIRALRAPEKPVGVTLGLRVDEIIASLPTPVLTELVVHREGEQWTRETEEALRAADLLYRNSLTGLGRFVLDRQREIAKEGRATEKMIDRMVQRAHIRYERDQDYVPEQEDAIQVEQAPALTFHVDDRVVVDGKHAGTVVFIARKGENSAIAVKLDHNGRTSQYPAERLETFEQARSAAADAAEAPVAPEAEEAITLQAGDRVLVDGTVPGVITRVDMPWNKDRYEVRLDKGSLHDFATSRVTFVSRPDSPTIVGVSLAQDDKYLDSVLEHCRVLSELLGLPDYVHYTMQKLQMMAPANVLAMQKNPVAAGKVLDTYEMHATMLLEGLQSRVFTYIQDLRDSVEQSS